MIHIPDLFGFVLTITISGFSAYFKGEMAKPSLKSYGKFIPHNKLFAPSTSSKIIVATLLRSIVSSQGSNLIVSDDDFDDEDDIPMPLELFNERRQQRIRDYYQVSPPAHSRTGPRTRYGMDSDCNHRSELIEHKNI